VAERTRRRSASGSSRRSTESGGGGRLNRDYGDEEYREPSEGYQGEQPTKGLYTAELVSITDHTKQGEEEPSSVKWLFRLAEGSVNKNGDDVSGFPDSVYTTENTLWREQQMLVALGVIKPGGKVNLPYEGIVKKAKACTVKIGMERYIPEDGDPEWRAKMQAFLPLREATGARRPKDEDEGEEAFEDGDDTDAEDEDEEEEPPARSRRSTSRSRRKAEPEPEDEEDEEPDADDEEDDEEDYDPDALAAELEELSLAALKKRARDEFKVKITRGMDADDIIEKVLDTLDEPEDDDDEEEDEEPEPPKRSVRSRGSAKTTSRGKAGTSRKRGSSDEPPF
jgi:hypothetical protein